MPAITIDSRQSGTNTAGAASISWSHTIAGGLTDSMLVVGCQTGSGVIKSVTSVTWGGVNLSNTVNGVAATQNDHSVNVNANLWFKQSPASGTANIIVTPSGSCELSGGSSSWSNVDPSTPFNAASPQTNQAPGGTPTVNITSAADEVVIDAVTWNETGAIGAITQGAGQTKIYALDNGAGTSAGAMSDELAIGTPTSMDWSVVTPANSNDWAIVGLSMRPSPGGATAQPVFRQQTRPFPFVPGGLDPR